MTLTLAIINQDRLQNGSPLELVLHNRGAIIGRSQTCEWPLPDESRTLSREHCKIQFRDGTYTIEDLSANGTFLGQDKNPISKPHQIQPGDRFRFGLFEIEAKLSGEALVRFEQDTAAKNKAASGPTWSNWDDSAKATQSATSAQPDPFASKAGGAWDMPAEQRENVSDWADQTSSKPLEPSSDEIFNSLTDNHKVDWSSASWDVDPKFDPFMSSEAEPSPTPVDPFGALEPEPGHGFGNPSQTTTPSVVTSDWPEPENPTTPYKSSPPQTAAIAAATTAHSVVNDGGSQAAYRELITALGVSSSSLSDSPEVAAARAGRMLRRLIAGLMKLLEARARAKEAMGANTTQLRFDGNNPLKFALDIDQALQMMMNPARKGYMEADQAIEDSYRDLQAHQMATLKAMQGALRVTLKRLSPNEIKARAKNDGLLAKLVPGQREATLWRAYEKQFSGSVEGSAEAFLDTFSAEFRKAYEEESRNH